MCKRGVSPTLVGDIRVNRDIGWTSAVSGDGSLRNSSKARPVQRVIRMITGTQEAPPDIWEKAGGVCLENASQSFAKDLDKDVGLQAGARLAG